MVRTPKVMADQKKTVKTPFVQNYPSYGKADFTQSLELILHSANHITNQMFFPQ
jgi:hypothetical protein